MEPEFDLVEAVTLPLKVEKNWEKWKDFSTLQIAKKGLMT